AKPPIRSSCPAPRTWCRLPATSGRCAAATGCSPATARDVPPRNSSSTASSASGPTISPPSSETIPGTPSHAGRTHRQTKRTGAPGVGATFAPADGDDARLAESALTLHRHTTRRERMQVRFTRHTSRLPQLMRFYRDRLGLREIGSFQDDDGYDGVFLE